MPTPTPHQLPVEVRDRVAGFIHFADGRRGSEAALDPAAVRVIGPAARRVVAGPWTEAVLGFALDRTGSLEGTAEAA